MHDMSNNITIIIIFLDILRQKDTTLLSPSSCLNFLLAKINSLTKKFEHQKAFRVSVVSERYTMNEKFWKKLKTESDSV